MNGWLIDKSALVRLDVSPDSREWASRIDRGLVFMTALSRLEIGYSARSASHLTEWFSRNPLKSIGVTYSNPAIEDRAFEILELLARRGHHRAPSPADLVLAATAAHHNLTILHVDKDFELIQAVTGQSIERLRLSDH